MSAIRLKDLTTEDLEVARNALHDVAEGHRVRAAQMHGTGSRVPVRRALSRADQLERVSLALYGIEKRRAS